MGNPTDYSEDRTSGSSFLKAGDGWSSRQEAARSGKRYVPRGGHLVDFSRSPAPESRTHSQIEILKRHVNRSRAKTLRVEIKTGRLQGAVGSASAADERSPAGRRKVGGWPGACHEQMLATSQLVGLFN